MVSPLNRKLLRDFRRLWAQALAIALVAAAGVMTLVLGLGTHAALFETRAAYYERFGFADVFASATRVPNGVLKRIENISGVAIIDTRIQQTAILDIAGMAEPAGAILLSLPDSGQAKLNRLSVLEGRMPTANHLGEIVLSQAFALAHGFGPGDRLMATMGGVKRQLQIVGVALSPEFIYSVGAGDVLPDDRRFGIIWMRYGDLAAAFDLAGAFNSVSLQLGLGANKIGVIDALDDILRPYGGQGAYGRSEQVSHVFLDSELVQLKAMSYIMPPIFLGVAAFLMNMTLARLVALEREQIGLLKALGYPTRSIVWHYLKLSLLIAGLGVLIGWGLGAWAARGLAAIYSEFYRFPFLLYQDRPDAFVISGVAAMAAAILGSYQAVRATASLSAAVAMAPPAPPVYKQFLLDRIGLTRRLPQGVTMAMRSLGRSPVRAMLTVTGIALSGGLLISGMFTTDSFEQIIDATFFRADRQQASLVFARPMPPAGMESVARLPGVLTVEPVRSVAVSLTNGVHKKRAGLIGKPARTDLSRVIDFDLAPVTLPMSGILLSEMMADLLDIRVGEQLAVEILDGREKIYFVPVSQIVQQFMGLGAYMEIGALNRLLGEGQMANGAHLRFDTSASEALFEAVKANPMIIGISLQRKSLEMFRSLIGENIGISQGIYIALAVIIVFGVVYNSMRIQLSERARELASLRVLGFTRSEVSVILLTEIAILTLIAIPVGWLVGYGMAVSVVEGFESELFRFPLIISRATYATTGLVVLGATVVSAYIVQRRVAKLDLVAVLKTRD